MLSTTLWLLLTLIWSPTLATNFGAINEDPIYTQIDPWIDQLHHHHSAVREQAAAALANLAYQTPPLNEAIIAALSLMLADRRWQRPLTTSQQAIWSDLLQLIARLPPTPISIMLLTDELDHAIWRDGRPDYPAVKALIQIGYPVYLSVKNIAYRGVTPHRRLMAQQVLTALSYQFVPNLILANNSS
jgi:hypothetical protein